MINMIIRKFSGKKVVLRRRSKQKINNKKIKVPGRLIHTNIIEIIAIKTIPAIIILSIYIFFNI